MIFFFFKQKTAYEMRISDWSSDVCSSDLATPLRGEQGMIAIREFLRKPKHRKNPDIPSLASIAPMRRHRCSLAITRQSLTGYTTSINSPSDANKAYSSARWEERRVGKECGSTYRTCWSQYH